MSNGKEQTREVTVPSTDLEPVAEKRPVPVLLIALLVVLLFWGDLYVMHNGGDIGGERGAFPAMVYFPYRSFAEIPQPEGGAAEGAKFYGLYCSICHQPNGMGTPGQFPPLAGSEWVLTENPERAIRIVLNGLTGPITVKGQPFNNTMTLQFRSMLTDEQIAATLTYVRNTWGNKAPPVKPEQVKAVRDATAGRSTYWTGPELEQVPEK
jgi:mono/diheme cytochrome c family protein